MIYINIKEKGGKIFVLRIKIISIIANIIIPIKISINDKYCHLFNFSFKKTLDNKTENALQQATIGAVITE